MGYMTGWNDPDLTNLVVDHPIEIGAASANRAVEFDKDVTVETPERNPADHKRQTADNERTRPTIITNPNFARLASKQGVRQEQKSTPGKGLQRSVHQHRASGQKYVYTTDQGTVSAAERGIESIAISPELRKHVISALEGSPHQTLPAMQTSPTSAHRSPTGPQKLPSLHSQLGPALPPPTPTVSLPGRSAAQTSTPAIPSPSQDYGAKRAGAYPLPSRSSAQYSMYKPSETSPSSAHSGVSPREPPSATNSMSPSSGFIGFSPIHTNGSNLSHPSPAMSNSVSHVPGEVQTPVSAGSQIHTPLSGRTQTSLSAFSSESSPIAERLPGGDETARGILLPLNASVPVVGGNFRCDHPGCNAPPFLTQYLLK